MLASIGTPHALRSLAALVFLQTALVACLAAPSPSGTPSASPTPSPTPSVSFGRRVCPPAQQLAGAIEGRIGFPSDVLPSLALYAIRTDGKGYRLLHLAARPQQPQERYAMFALEPGEYTVLAYRLDERGEVTPAGFAGSYTKAIACGLTASCTDHASIRVTVRSGTTTKDVDVLDWYAPQNFFPPPPSGGEPFKAGERLAVCNPFADEANLRASAGTGATLVRALPNGTELDVSDGPRPADGYDWYAVRTEAGMGWIVGYALRR